MWDAVICSDPAHMDFTRARCGLNLGQHYVAVCPSLKRLSGIQVQLLSLCMGKHQILQNCSLSLRLNFIFEITNEIGQQRCHKCCFFCSNSVIKSLFLRLDQPVRMPVLSAHLRALTVSIATETSNASCSDALTLPISDWLFHSEGGASCDRAAILSVAFFPIQNVSVTCVTLVP